MMKKLVVTLFALSLTALGCGSDDGGKKDAAPKLDTPPGAEVQPQTDVPITKTDVPVTGPEVQVDKPIGPEVQAVEVQAVEVQAVEVQKVEVQAVEVGIDGKPIDVQPKVDGGTPDVPVGIDGGKADTQQPTEAGKAIDGGVDGGSAG